MEKSGFDLARSIARLSAFLRRYEIWRKEHPHAKMMVFGQHPETFRPFKPFNPFMPPTHRGLKKDVPRVSDFLYSMGVPFTRVITTAIERNYILASRVAKAFGLDLDLFNEPKVPPRWLEEYAPELYEQLFTQLPEIEVPGMYSGRLFKEQVRQYFDEQILASQDLNIFFVQRHMLLYLMIHALFDLGPGTFLDLMECLPPPESGALSILTFDPDKKKGERWGIEVWADNNYSTTIRETSSQNLKTRYSINVIRYYAIAIRRAFERALARNETFEEERSIGLLPEYPDVLACS